jgi:glycosyltransferase involved in cell wall biosynthesis
MSQRKKILFFVSRVPYPLEKGDKLRAYQLIKNLSINNDIYLAVVSTNSLTSEAKIELSKFVKEIFFYKQSKFSIFSGLSVATLSKFPFQVGYFYNSGADLYFKKIIDEIKPDHLFTQLIRMGEYIKGIEGIPASIDYMDSFSKGMERRKLQSSGIKRFIFGLEEKKLRYYETYISKYFKNKFIISHQDKETFDPNIMRDIKVLLNGVDDTFFKRNESVDKIYDVVFTGNMSYPPNVDAVTTIAKKIMPIIWKSLPEAKFLIAGASPNTQVKSLASDKVIVSGWIDDIRDAYNQGKVFVAPLKIGTGLQNKLLEAMCMEVPCITTQLANNALNAEPNKSIFIEETDIEFAEKAIFLLKNPDECKRITLNAYNFIKQNYNWGNITKKLESILFNEKEN